MKCLGLGVKGLGSDLRLQGLEVAPTSPAIRSD